MQVSDSGNQTSSIYPFLILAMLSLVAVFDNRSPLNSLRPDQVKLSEVRKPKGTFSIFEINQRIWEDPFKDSWFHQQVPPRSVAKEAVNQNADPTAFVTLPQTAESVLLMPIIFPDRAVVRDQEERSRRRYAIHQALSVAGYRSMDTAHIAGLQLNHGERVAVERFEIDGLSQQWYRNEPIQILGDYSQQTPAYVELEDFQKQYNLIVAVYVRSSDIDNHPIDQLTAIKEDLLKRSGMVSKADIDVRFIGPASSGQVFKIVSDLGKQDETVEEFENIPQDRKLTTQNAFFSVVQYRLEEQIKPKENNDSDKASNLYMFSPVATADYETLGGQANAPPSLASAFSPGRHASPESRLAQTEAARNTLQDLTDIRFIRTVHADSAVFEELLKELNTRNLLKQESDLRTIALITESDTRYGRSMTANFLKAAQNHFSENYESDDDAKAAFKTHMATMRVFPYISGLDGDLSVRNEQSESSSEPSTSSDSYLPAEKTWNDPIAHGNHQIDYVRRLAEDIIRQTKEGETPVRVIGILGTDVYDKLLLMRALKPVVGEVQFFTTDLDARLWHSSEIKFTRNMIVGSSHGLKLNEKLQRFVPPFRDSYQASIFASVLLAANAIRYPYEIDHYTPQVFEIGRTAPVYLRGGDYNGPAPATDTANSSLTPLFPDQVTAEKSWILFWWLVTLTAIGLAIGFSKYFANRFQGPHSRELTPIAYSKLFISNGIFAVIITVVLLVIPGEELEPLSLHNGTSAWPSFFLNLFNATLAVSLGTYIGITRIDAANRALEKHTSLRVNKPRDTGGNEPWWKKNPEFLNYFILFFASAIYGLLFDRFANNEDRFGDPIAFFLSLLIVPAGLFLLHALRADLRQLLKSTRERTILTLDNDEAMRIRTLYFPLFLMMLLTASWALASNYNFLPLRSPAFHGLFGLSQLLQITTMLTLLSYVVYESIWVTALVWGLSKRTPAGTIWDSDNILKLSSKERELKATHDEKVLKGEAHKGDEKDLLQIGARCVDFTSRITEVPNRYLVYPFIVLMIWFLGQNTDFEGWAWTQLRWFLAFCLFGFCLLPTAILRISAMKLRSRVVQQLNDAESAELFAESIKTSQRSSGDFISRLQSIRRGAYAPMLNQPAVLAILTPMGGLGSLALIKLFLSYVV